MSAAVAAPAATQRSAVRIVALAVTTAVVLNVAVHAVGRAAGGSFRFTSPRGPAEVDWVAVAVFSAVPLLLGLVLATVLARRWAWVMPTALVVAPALALVTVALMTVPADLDDVSTMTLAVCHVVLAPVSVLALRALGDRTGAGRRVLF